MNRMITTIIGILFLQNIAFAQTPTHTPKDPHWKSTPEWEDNFSNLNNWLPVPYTDHWGTKIHLCLEKNIWLNNNGNLVIAVNNEFASCPNPAPPVVSWASGSCTAGKFYSYTGGWIETKNNNNTKTQFGYIEARMKIPYRPGLYLSFWTFIKEGSVGNAAEIDIFEIRGMYPYNVLPTNVHTDYNIYEGFDYDIIIPDPNFTYTDWHNYAIEWDANRIIWYVDGIARRVLNNHGVIDPVRIIFSMGTDQYPFSPKPPLYPLFQDSVLIDYFKVYHLQCDNTPVINPNFASYDYKVKKSIIMGGATTVPQNSNIVLRATDFIELQPGFEVPLNTEIYLDVTPCVGNKIGKKED